MPRFVLLESNAIKPQKIATAVHISKSNTQNMKLSSHAQGVIIGVGAVLTGSPVFVLVRVLGHSSAFTQILCRSPYFLFILFICMCMKWKTINTCTNNLKSLGFKGSLACIFLATQSIAIFAALLLVSLKCMHSLSLILFFQHRIMYCIRLTNHIHYIQDTCE